ncbi:FAD-dependent oxidoreductase [Halobacteria archaeon AArc-dxtr1]|nr:FAD-dependent oxidoreductase [Halobacteria archaeon AArc-dxtr1]
MHVVVLGAGYAGLTLTRLLERTLPSDVELTVINESPDHLLQHELHRVIRRPSLAEEITVSLPSALDRATVHVATVEEVDRESRTVHCSTGTVSYDVAATCLGAETAYYGLTGVREHATPLKRLEHAIQIRRGFYEALREDSGGPRIVVGGAGLSGIQVAGELAALAEQEGVAATVTILEQEDSVAPSFPANFQRAVADALADAGVVVRTEATVTDADEKTVHLASGERLAYDQFVWAGGIRGADALAGDRPTVRADLRLDDRTVALGDAARVIDADGEAVPASAQSAIREAKTAATNVVRTVEAVREADGRGSEPADTALDSFAFDSPGWLVSIGDDAVAQVGSAIVTGRAAKAMKAGVGVGYLSSVGGARNAVGLAGSELGCSRE